MTSYQLDSRGPRLAADGKDFNDPTAWGYCDYCAFLVAVLDGVRISHQRFRMGHDDAICNGSGLEPVEPVPVTAEARQRVSLRKTYQHTQSRSRCQRQRATTREALRRLRSREETDGASVEE